MSEKMACGKVALKKAAGPRKAGRPSEKTESREKLIASARELFMVMPYDKVSTRLVAEKAQVNVAMIRYYFGNKQGLFETMVRDTIEPIRRQMQQFVLEESGQGMINLMRAYYRTMLNVPQFPRLIIQVMNMPESELQRTTLEKVINDVTKPVQEFLFERLSEKGVLREGMDPNLCKMTFISMMIFPFIAPRPVLAMNGVTLNQDYLDRLLEHNIQVFSQGFLSQKSQEQQISPGENNNEV